MGIAGYIEHTNLRPDATHADIVRLCDEATGHGFHGVAINTSRVLEARAHLDATGSDAAIVACVGFPLGAMSIQAKAFEAEQAVRDGADEIDMVISVGRLLDGDDGYVREDVSAVVEAAGGRPVKAILECCLLTPADTEHAVRLCGESGASFVKTSTGFSKWGARADDVRLMARVAGEYGMGVKAAGGIHTYGEAMEMIGAGATRIGCSAGIAIVEGEAGRPHRRAS